MLFLLNSITSFSQFNFQRSWGTYFGDERFELADSKIDRAGNLYIVGSFYGVDTTSLYPFTNTTSHQQFYGGGDYDGFIVKFNPQGNIVWGTYFGGFGEDKIKAIDIDNNDNLYIIGYTLSNTNIATIGAFQEGLGGNRDAFISRFSEDGNLVWSTYLGGNETDEGNEIAFDSQNYIYIGCNSTNSEDLATTGVFQEIKGNSSSLIAKFDIAGNRIWASYFGIGRSIFDIKANLNSVYVTGSTNDCPPNNSYNTYYGTPNGFKPLPSNCREIYLSKFNTIGQREWSTYYGGNESEGTNKNSIALKDNKIYLSGTSPDYINQEVATSNTFQPFSNNASNFVVQFNEDCTRNWGTYNGNYSNSSNVFPFSSVILEKQSNSFYNYGSTGMDNNITTADGYLTTTNSQFSSDAFICKFTDQNTKSWGTYYGGELEERDIDFHNYNNGNKFYIVGTTQSLTQITTINGLQQTKQVFDTVNYTQQSAYNIFIAHFEPNPLSNTTFIQNLFSIFPNPNSGVFTIKLNYDNFENSTLEIFDILGKKLFTQTLTNEQTIINTNNIAKGIYIIKLNIDNQTITSKIVVE